MDICTLGADLINNSVIKSATSLSLISKVSFQLFKSFNIYIFKTLISTCQPLSLLKSLTFVFFGASSAN